MWREEEKAEEPDRCRGISRIRVPRRDSHVQSRNRAKTAQILSVHLPILSLGIHRIVEIRVAQDGLSSGCQWHMGYFSVGHRQAA